MRNHLLLLFCLINAYYSYAQSFPLLIQKTEWTKMDTTDGCSAGKKIVHDSEGNVYIASNSTLYNFGANYEGLQKITKYNTYGEKLWTYDFRKLDSLCWLGELLIDKDDNIVCIGTAGKLGGFVKKMDKNGIDIWLYSTHKKHVYISAVIDNEGTIYVAGWDNTPTPAYINTLVFAIDHQGHKKWENIHNSPQAYFVNASISFCISPQGNAFLVETSYDKNEVRVIRYNNTGNITLEKEVTYIQDAAMLLAPTDIIVDKDENIYLTINADTLNGQLSLFGDEGAIIALDREGSKTWEKYYRADKGLLPIKMVFDQAQNIYLMGNIVAVPDPPFSNRIGYLVKFSPHGKLLWETHISFMQERGIYSYMHDMMITPQNYIYIVGESGAYSEGNNNLYKELYVAKFNTFGDALWGSIAGGNLAVTNSDYYYARDYGLGLTVDNEDNVYATGSFTIGTGSIDAKPSCSVVKIRDTEEVVITWAAQAYPNPFSSQLTFQLDIPYKEEVSIIIWNALGQIVYQNKETLSVGKKTIVWTPNTSINTGYYFYQIVKGKDISQGKVLYVR